MQTKGDLYICPTPIGNLEDITLRAIKTLQEVDLIACEDTRVTQKLLNRYEIKTKLTSYHKFSEKEKSVYLIKLLNEGNNVALVSDAGTPLISDPGAELIKLAHENSLKIIPLAGASSITTALSASSVRETPFVFLGFFPKKIKEKEAFLFKYSDINIVAFESPNRLVKTLKEIHQIIGNKSVTVARELTKIYEEVKNDSLLNLIDYYSQKQPKGEIVLIIEGQEKQQSSIEEVDLAEKIRILKNEGYSVKDLSKIISSLYKFPKKEVYNLAVELFEK